MSPSPLLLFIVGVKCNKIEAVQQPIITFGEVVSKPNASPIFFPKQYHFSKVAFLQVWEIASFGILK